MKPVHTLALYAGALAVVFGAAAGVGNAVGPVAGVAAPHSAAGDEHSAAGDEPSAAGDEHSASGDEHGAVAGAPDAGLPPGGLAVTQDGYTLRLARATHAPAAPGPLSFDVTGPDGRRITEFTRTHDKDLHLIVVRRDLTGYQHLHPTQDAQGLWTVPLTLPEPGPYKVFADFTPAGRDTALTLAADLTVPGTYRPVPLPPPARTTTVDGYAVALDGDLVAGTSSRLTLTVSRDGVPVTDLQPYLGAYGHLVALREGDLAYLHVHPDGEVDDPSTPSGPDVTFYVDVPSPATYRLFLDFSHGGAVRTAGLTARAARAAEDSPAETADHSADTGRH